MKRGDIQNVEPWSELEVARGMAFDMERGDDEVALLKSLGISKTQKAKALREHMAHWMLHAKVNLPDLKSDAMREAWIIDQVEGTSDLMFEAEVAEAGYKDAILALRHMESDADTLRSMMVSARKREESWPENRPPRPPQERR